VRRSVIRSFGHSVGRSVGLARRRSVGRPRSNTRVVQRRRRRVGRSIARANARERDATHSSRPAFDIRRPLTVVVIVVVIVIIIIVIVVIPIIIPPQSVTGGVRWGHRRRVMTTCLCPSTNDHVSGRSNDDRHSPRVIRARIRVRWGIASRRRPPSMTSNDRRRRRRRRRRRARATERFASANRTHFESIGQPCAEAPSKSRAFAARGSPSLRG